MVKEEYIINYKDPTNLGITILSGIILAGTLITIEIIIWNETGLELWTRIMLMILSLEWLYHRLGNGVGNWILKILENRTKGMKILQAIDETIPKEQETKEINIRTE